jgi:hypothetical protein
MNNLQFAIFETYALFFIQLALLAAGVLIIVSCAKRASQVPWPTLRAARTGHAVEANGVGGLKIAVAIALILGALTPAILHTLGL